MIWRDGRVFAAHAPGLDLSDRGLLLGDGLFETVPFFGGAPFLLEAHVERMAAAARAIGLPLDAGRVRAAVADLARVAPAPHGVVRVTATRGPGLRGLRVPAEASPALFAQASPWPGLDPAPVRLATSPIRRNASSPLSRIKSLGYLDQVLALEGAIAAGADDALMLNGEGRVACASAANLLLVRGDALVTPPPLEGVLPGVTRALLLERAPRLGLRVVERPVEPGELLSAEAAVLTNSVRLVRRVSALDGAALPDGRAWAARLLGLVLDAVAQACGGAVPP